MSKYELRYDILNLDKFVAQKLPCKISLHQKCSLFKSPLLFNPRMQRKFTPHRGTRGGNETLPRVLDMLKYFEMILPLVESH